MLDDIDRKILAVLQGDALVSQSYIANLIGHPTSTVNDRISRMRKNGTIKNLVANIDASKAGLSVLAFISVLIDWNKSNETFSAAVKKMPEVLECHNVTGDWSYLLKVRAINNSTLEELISNKIKRFPGVTRSETIFVLQTDKETSALPLSL
tara:strand:- start:399 stop:854 length:456 start_codon:yes stop_codon:yes gene_type:complete